MGKQRRIKKKKNFAIFCLLVLLILCGAGVLIGNTVADNISKAYDPQSDEFIAVTIPAGSSTSKVASILEENGIIGSANGFKLFLKLNNYDGKLQAGDYSLSPSMNAQELAQAMLSGRNNTTRFTIPEGYTVKQTAEKLANEGLVDYDTFMYEAEHGSFDYGFMDQLPAGEDRLEGFLFPETYEIYVTADEHDIINKMLAQFNKVFTDEYVQRANELGMSIRDVIIAASIVEREAQIDDDRPLVASVIFNRLNIGMNLQMCSTVQYILGEPKAVLSTADTQIVDPYNTYINPGLPPGPIASPGKASIEATLYPADTDYLYFVVSEKLDGSHAFSSNYNQFLKDKEAYQRALR